MASGQYSAPDPARLEVGEADPAAAGRGAAASAEPAAPEPDDQGLRRLRRLLLGKGTAVGPGVAVVLGLAGLLFAASGSTAAGTDLRSGTEDLTTLIAREQNRANEQARVLDGLRTRVDDLRSGISDGDAVAAGLEADAAALAGPAGLEPLTGPAVRVWLDDADYGSPLTSRAEPDDLIVHQQDVQAVVNALWLGGAEGMMLMDQRVISTSAVRCVGNTLSLQGEPYSPPYSVTAVGDVDGMLAALEDNPNVQIYRQYVDAFGLGYSVEQLAEVELPAYSGPLELQHAQVHDS